MDIKRLLIIGLFFIPALIVAQEKKLSSRSSAQQKEAVLKLSKSLEENKSDNELAEDYENLAKEFSKTGDYAKAEENLLKAKRLYERQKNKEKLAEIERELAKIKEAQNQIEEAISNFNSASLNSTSPLQKQINVNDAKRLMNQSNPEAQSAIIQKNIDLLQSADQAEERSEAYKQMASVNIALDEKDKAIENLEMALKEVKNQPEAAAQIKSDIAKVYAEEQQFEKAIEIKEQMIKEAEPEPKIEQMQELAQTYLKAGETQKGIEILQQSYRLAVEQHRTLDAKKSLEAITEYYKQNKNTQAALTWYDNFLENLEPLMYADSSLIDSKLMQSIEARISQLEKERELQKELIERKNIINYFLISLIILILIFAVFITKMLYSINKKNKKIALQSLRREMNPHFIFNSLNSVNQFIAQNNELEANKYLSSYSKLMRNIMENSNRDFIPLAIEMAQLKEYLQLEYMRFSDKFEYDIHIDPQISPDEMLIPNMLIQPQLENAVWHGLRYKENKGMLNLTIASSPEGLLVKIEDNGIGIKRSQELKTKHQKQHHSRGMSNTHERISLLNSLYHTQITIETTDKQGEETGVIVTIKVPELKKK